MGLELNLKLIAGVQSAFMLCAFITSTIALAGCSEDCDVIKLVPWTHISSSDPSKFPAGATQIEQWANFWGVDSKVTYPLFDVDGCQSYRFMGVKQNDKRDTLRAMAIVGWIFTVAYGCLVVLKLFVGKNVARRAHPDQVGLLVGLIAWTFTLANWAIVVSDDDWKSDGFDWAIGFGSCVTCWCLLTLTYVLNVVSLAMLMSGAKETDGPTVQAGDRA